MRLLRMKLTMGNIQTLPQPAAPAQAPEGPASGQPPQLEAEDAAQAGAAGPPPPAGAAGGGTAPRKRPRRRRAPSKQTPSPQGKKGGKAPTKC